MTHTEADVERVGDVVERILTQRVMAKRLDGYTLSTADEIARAVLAAMPSPAIAVLQEARDACAAACRVIAEAGLSERLEAELAKAGVPNGFGARMDAALAALEDQP